MSYMKKNLHFFNKKKCTTEGRTDGRTDRPSYRDATTHLKMSRDGRKVETNWQSDKASWPTSKMPPWSTSAPRAVIASPSFPLINRQLKVIRFCPLALILARSPSQLAPGPSHLVSSPSQLVQRPTKLASRPTQLALRSSQLALSSFQLALSLSQLS